MENMLNGRGNLGILRLININAPEKSWYIEINKY
jgi:hypothetical protein